MAFLVAGDRREDMQQRAKGQDSNGLTVYMIACCTNEPPGVPKVRVPVVDAGFRICTQTRWLWEDGNE